MKIGMILDKVFPPDPRVENEAIELTKSGHSVFLFCLHYGGQLEKEMINGINVRRYKSNTIIYKSSALVYTVPFYSNMMKFKINDFVIKNNIEVLHIHDIQIAEAVFKANKKYNLPIVLDLHENRPEILKFYPHLSKFPVKYLISIKKWKRKEEEFIKKADKIIVITDEAKEEICKRVKIINQDKMITVPNTVREDFFKNTFLDAKILNKYSNKFVILYIGDTGIRRGLLTVINSINIIKKLVKNLKLVIVGKNSTDNILKEKVSELNLEKYVDFLGWKSPKLFQSFIKVSDICISPLHRNLHHDTTYANKLFQYMSLGKPLLVSDALAQKKMIEKYNTGLVHMERNTKDFADKILKLYTNKVLRESLGENGKNFVRNHFTWEKTSEELIKLYDNLAN